jgi:RNA recognition motif-containing protein
MALYGLPQLQEAKLFVGNLPSDITNEELQYVFSNYGTVSKLHIMDSARSKSGQACAFVSYSTPEAAAIAVRTLNNVYKIRVDAPEAITVSVAKGSGQPEGSAIAAALVAAAVAPTVNTVGLQPPGGVFSVGTEFPTAGLALGQATLGLEAAVAAAAQQSAALQLAASQIPLVIPGLQPAFALPTLAPSSGPTQQCKLFVGDLPSDITREALIAVFSTYGAVTDVHLMTGKSRSGAACALIEYSNITEAQTAINTLHQKYEIRPGAGMITVRIFEGSKGNGKGGAVDGTSLGTTPATEAGTSPASLRYTPY